jgi:hypothetical protein
MPPTAPHVWTLVRMLRVPPSAAGPHRVLRAASRPRELRDNAHRHHRPRDHTGTAVCGRVDGATRRCSTSRAHQAVLIQRRLRAGSAWEPRGASDRRVDLTGSTGRERLRRSCKISELPHEHSQRLVTTNGSICLFTARTDANLPMVIRLTFGQRFERLRFEFCR